MDLPGTPNSMYLSGSDDSNTIGFVPFYRNALGVFYLNKKPIINYSDLPENKHQYSLVTNSVEYLFNPSVLEVAEINNIQQEIVAIAENKHGDKEWYSGQSLTSNIPLDILGVRVSIDVIPKNGTQKVHIMKTFQATVKVNTAS